MSPTRHLLPGNRALPRLWQFATMVAMSAETPPPNFPQDRAHWLKRRSLRVAGVAALLLVLVGLAAPYFLNADRFRVMLANLIATQTGREVTLGKMRVRLLPRVGFAVESFRMGNPASFAKGDFVSAEEVRGALAFWPLVLRHEYRITSLELVKPKLALLEDASGRNNYTFEPAGTGPTPSQASFAVVGAAPAAETSELLVDALTLRDAEVIYGGVDAAGRTAPIIDATGFNAVLLHLVLQPLRIGAWQAAARLGGTRLTLAGWEGPISFRDGDISLRNGALESSFTVDFGKPAIVEGMLSVPDVEHAAVKFDLKTTDLDLAAFIANVQTASDRRAPAGGRSPALIFVRDVVSGAVSPAASNELLAEGHLAAEKIRLAPYAAGPATADLRLYPDRLEIWPVTIRLYGGSLQASARTDRRQTPQRFSTNMEARNLNLGEFVNTTPAARGNFAGTGELDLQMYGSLDATWQKSLGGHGEFAVRNGRIRGLNLAGAAQSMAEFFGIGGDTTFTAITGDINIRNQRVASSDVRLNSPRDTADMVGSLGFDGSLNFDGQLMAQIEAPPAAAGDSGNASGNTLGALLARNGGKLTVPFALRGTLAQPELGPGHTLPNFPPAAQPNQQSCCSFPNLFHK